MSFICTFPCGTQSFRSNLSILTTKQIFLLHTHGFTLSTYINVMCSIRENMDLKFAYTKFYKLSS